MKKLFLRTAAALMLLVAPVKSLWAKDVMNLQIDVFGKMPFTDNYGRLHCFGAEMLPMLNFTDHISAKFGLALDFGKSSHPFREFNFRQNTMLELGVPVLLELYGGSKRNKNGVYFDLGVVPSYYTMLSSKEYVPDTPEIWIKDLEKSDLGFPIDAEKEKGIYISPKLEIGTYVNINKNSLKLGVFGQYILNMSEDSKGQNIFKERLSRGFIGANFGVLF